ncbi:MAG: hypothetical protein IPP77_05395 [Bacteroidetes bacterium]|nr:hypothetical protein [Bacteroidota bacterium]
MVTSDIYLRLENLKSPGGNGVYFKDGPLELNFDFKFLKVSKVAVRTEKEHTEMDTTEILFTDDVKDYDNNAAEGTLRVFLTNAMPINYNFQMYFLDDSRKEQ